MTGKANHVKWVGWALLLLVTVRTSAAGPRDDLWNQVDDAIKRGLPKTAIAILDQIIPEALQDQAHAEATKAICRKIALEGQIQGGKAEEMIVRLETEIAEAPDPMKPTNDGGNPGPLVLAVFPAEPLAFRQADPDRRTTWGGLHDLGPAPYPGRDRLALHPGLGCRPGAQGHPHRSV